MLSTQHTTDILSKFETYLDDATELPAQEELELANKIYKEICNQRPWVFLKKSATGTLTIGVDAYGNSQATIALPSNFKYLAINNLSTDNTVSTDNGMKAVVIFISCQTNAYIPYQVVNYADRRQFLNGAYAWVDPTVNKIVFASVPSASDLTYEFDYISIPPDLTAATQAPYSDPIFRCDFWDAIYHKMACDDQIIQIFDRAHSYMAENQQRYDKIVLDMIYEDSQSYLN